MACEHCTPDKDGECYPIGNWPDSVWLSKEGCRWMLYTNMGSRQQVFYCPMCGEELRDSKLDQFEKCCADVIERVPNTLDMLGDQ